METKKILVVLTNHDSFPSMKRKTGLWLGELTHFYGILDQAGYKMDFVSPEGGKVPIDPHSLGRFFLDRLTRAYYEDRKFMQRLENTFSPDEIDSDDYVAIYYTGGHGTMWDFPENKKLQEISQKIYESGGIVSAVCHGVCGLLNIKLANGECLITGRRVTGFSWTEEKLAMLAKHVPFNLEKEIKRKGARYSKGFLPLLPYGVTDGRLITGQNPTSAKEVARRVIRALVGKPEKPKIWKKCFVCAWGSWVVGLSAVALVIAGIFELTLPTGLLAKIIYVGIGINAIGFVYYQIVPCPMCARKNA